MYLSKVVGKFRKFRPQTTRFMETHRKTGRADEESNATRKTRSKRQKMGGKERTSFVVRRENRSKTVKNVET
jgi:hypothetical protein